jgi:hypothetical protein
MDKKFLTILLHKYFLFSTYFPRKLGERLNDERMNFGKKLWMKKHEDLNKNVISRPSKDVWKTHFVHTFYWNVHFLPISLENGFFLARMQKNWWILDANTLRFWWKSLNTLIFHKKYGKKLYMIFVECPFSLYFPREIGSIWCHELFPNEKIPNVKIPNVKIPNWTINSHKNPKKGVS